MVLQAALVFFNADYVKRRQIIEIADALGEDSKWLILDAEAINVLDSTGVAKLEELRVLLRERGVIFGIADLNSRSLLMVEHAGLADQMGSDMIFVSSEAAVAAFKRNANRQLIEEIHLHGTTQPAVGRVFVAPATPEC